MRPRTSFPANAATKMTAREANVLSVTSATRALGMMSAIHRSAMSAEARMLQSAATLRSFVRLVGKNYRTR
jgi:hypothetical protein